MEGPRARILCTEDHADTRDMISVLLGAAGFEVTCADCAADALHIARAEPFDLYLLDNWLPDLPGSGLCQQIREFDTKTPILFFSAAAYESDKHFALNSGAQAYLTKPATGDALIAKVQELIAESRNQESVSAP